MESNSQSQTTTLLPLLASEIFKCSRTPTIPSASPLIVVIGEPLGNVLLSAPWSATPLPLILIVKFALALLESKPTSTRNHCKGVTTPGFVTAVTAVVPLPKPTSTSSA